MKKTLKIIGGIVVIVVIWVLVSSLYVIDETEQVVITEFGKPVGEPITEPGLYFKKPLIQTTHFFDKRFLEWNGDRNQVPTKDKRFIWVDTYARWKIVDPLKFYQRVRNEAGGQSRLDDIIDGATRDAVANHQLIELVRATTEDRELLVDPELSDAEQAGIETVDVARTEIMSKMLEEVDQRTEDLGVKVIDVRFKRINYNEDVRQSVYQRMIAERKRIAARYRSEGQGEAANIRGQKEKELKQITSQAYRRAEEIKGEADAKATAIYAGAYTRSPEFYDFLRTMESYPKTFDEESTLLLSTDSDFFRYFKEANPGTK
jgi:membrane protease subunit HflC